MSLEYLCKNCSTSFVRYSTLNKLCGKCQYNKYAKKPKPIKRMGKVAKAWVEHRHKWIQKNATESGTWNCHYCGTLLTIDSLTLDHVIPRSARPDLRFKDSNLVPACFDCNNEKGSRH